MSEKTKKEHVRHAILQTKNRGTWIEKFTSSRPITIKRLLKWLEKKYKMNWDKDCATLIGNPRENNID